MFSNNLQKLCDRSDWSLAEDRQLCGLLEEVSLSLNSRISSVTNTVQRNASKIINACVMVSNVNNRLSSFASDQLIENRVGDDAVMCVEHISAFHSTSTDKQAEVTNNLRAAVSLGLELVRARFKRIDMRPEDFDEVDDPTFMPEPMFEPYDESLSRQLPFLIGSPDWMSSSCLGTFEDYAEIKRVSEEVVISLPPFAQSRISTAAPMDSQSNSLAKNTICTTSSASSSENSSCSHEADKRAITRLETAASSTLKTSLRKEVEVDRMTDTILDSSRKKASFHIPESSARRSFLADIGNDQSKISHVKAISGGSEGLFTDSSDEDDLFNEFRNTDVKAKKCGSPACSDDMQKSQITERKNLHSGLVRSSAMLNEASNSKSPLLEKDGAAAAEAEIVKTGDEFRENLDSIIINRMSPSAVNGSENNHCKVNNTETNGGDEFPAVLPSLSKLRDKGPPRRSPSRSPKQSGREDTGIHSGTNASMAKGKALQEAGEHEVKQQNVESGEQKDSKLSSVKGRIDVGSLFSSDSDDDIFSTFPNEQKTPVVSSSQMFRDKQEETKTPHPVGNHRATTANSPVEIVNGNLKPESLFDSDDDIFAISAPSLKHPSVEDTKTTWRKPRPRNAKTVDIFDDSDDDLFK